MRLQPASLWRKDDFTCLKKILYFRIDRKFVRCPESTRPVWTHQKTISERCTAPPVPFKKSSLQHDGKTSSHPSQAWSCIWDTGIESFKHLPKGDGHFTGTQRQCRRICVARLGAAGAGLCVWCCLSSETVVLFDMHHIHPRGAGGSGTAGAGLPVLQAHRWHHAAAQSDLSSDAGHRIILDEN